MEGIGDGRGVYQHQPGVHGAPPLDSQRRPSAASAGTPVYTPYNPFLHAAPTPSAYAPLPPQPHSYPLASTSGPPNFDGRRGLSPAQHGFSGPEAITDLANMSAMYHTSVERGDASGGGDVTAGQGGEEGAPKISKRADRSCKTCRTRRVRCSREYPVCSRCKKRRDDCNYGEGVYVEETVEGSDQAKISELEGKVASLELQLRSTNASTASRPATSSSAPPPAETTFSRRTLPSSIARAVTELLSANESALLSSFIADESTGRPSSSNIDHRLSGAALDDGLTCYLLDATARACDAKLPSFSALTARIAAYKGRLRDLEPAGQVSVAILCALGARTTVHPQVFGIPSVLAADGTPSPPFFLAVGTRRERACQAFEARARETAWSGGLLHPTNAEGLEALVGLVGLCQHEENKSEDVRFLVRQAVGSFIDLRHSELSRTMQYNPACKNLATAIFMADAVTAVQTSKPNLISPAELNDYFATVGLEVPDLNSNLSDIVEAHLHHTTAASVTALLDIVFVHVGQCYRVMNQLTSSRRATSSPILGFIRSLWNLLDQKHNAIQRLQQHLVSQNNPILGSEHDPHFLDHAILLAVRADDILVMLVMLVHRYLCVRRDDVPYWTEREGDEELERVRAESMLRVFKCLKLLAFYCQLHISSQDKHNVYHVLLQLGVLPDWTTLVNLRIGQPDGPLSEEFEASDEEGDWFRQALELSCFYSPRAAPILSAFLAARAAHMPRQPVPPTLPSLLFPTTSFSSSANQNSPAPYQHQQQHQQHLSHPQQQQTLPSANTQPVFPPPPPSTMYDFSSSHPQPPNSASGSIPFPPPQHQHQQPRSHSLPGDLSLPFTLEMSWGQTGFADGAGEDISGDSTSTDVRDAFRAVDWGDLSLTPAVGSDGSSSSLDEWMRLCTFGDEERAHT
ncbi:hypothetical protein JCM8547_004611 [Rhodosporidiobolus lusitaniae]